MRCQTGRNCWSKRLGSPSGPGGAVFEAALHDWSVKLDTTQIRGVRELRAALLDRAGREVALATRRLTVGDQAPTLVRFLDPPLKAWRQAPLALQARGSDDLAGVKEVNFFFGRPVNDKPPPGAALVPGTAENESRTLWAVKLPAPTDRKGPTEVSVQFVNRLGLSAFATTTVDLEENDPAKTAPGKILGKVLEGDRPQAGLTVYLTDDKRAERGKQVSKADGSFEFDNLPAGKYRLGVERATPNRRVATYPRKGTDFIELAPGGSVTADLSLLLP
ncbi:MAG: carboxypeptidase-like regulatory domain-containing protein [Gemmataceae bacterium]